MGWLNGFKYRKAHTLSSPSNVLINCPVRLNIHYGSGFDFGEDVYLDGKCQKDFEDVRITDSDGVTVLAPRKDNSWIEKIDGDYMKIWFKVPFIPKHPKKENNLYLL